MIFTYSISPSLLLSSLPFVWMQARPMLFWFPSVIKAKGKTPFKKTQKKSKSFYTIYCLSLIFDTTLSYSLLGLAPGTGPIPLFDYTLSLRDAPDILMLFLSFFVLYNTITNHSRRRRREVQKWNIIYLARKWKLEVLVLCFFWYFSHFGRNWGWTSQAGLNILTDGESVEARRVHGYCHFHSSFDLPGKKHVLDSTLYCN